MNKRIRKLRKTLDLTQQEFGERIGMKQNTIALIEGGRNTSEQTVFAICREFNVNENWLRAGEGEMFNPATTSELDALVAKYNLSDGARVMIEKFVELKPEQQDNLLNYILKVADDLNHSNTIPTSTGVAAAEVEYEKSLGIAPRGEFIASSITNAIEDEREGEAG